MPIVKEEGLAEFADIFTEKNVFSVEDSEYYMTKAKEMGFKLKIHADEIYQLGGSELAARVGAVSADHLLKASDEGIRQMRDAGDVYKRQIVGFNSTSSCCKHQSCSCIKDFLSFFYARTRLVLAARDVYKRQPEY